jgi:hypothetical protein
MIVENPDSLIPEFPGLVARGDEGHPRVANRNAPEDAPRAPLTTSDGRVAGQISGAEAASGERQSADAKAAHGADARRVAETRDGRAAASPAARASTNQPKPWRNIMKRLLLGFAALLTLGLVAC